MHDAAYKLIFSHPQMVADLLRGFLPGGAWPGFDFGTVEPLPPVIPFVVYNGHPRWTAPPDVSELIVPTAGELARLQPSNRYVLLDMQRANTGGVPEDNAVGLQVALEQAMLEEKMPILHRVEAVLAGAGHAELRHAFAAWLRRSYEEDYGVFADGDDALRRELDRLENAGEVVKMGSLAAERWKERNRKKEAQIFARTMERGLEQGMAQGLEQGLEQGMEQGLEFHRSQLGSLAARRFGADAGERLLGLLAGVSEPERLVAAGEAIVDCGTGAELLAAVRRVVGTVNSAG